jgi:hypothetical protein
VHFWNEETDLDLGMNLQQKSKVVSPFQIIRRFGFLKSMAFAMHLDIHYDKIYSKINISRQALTSYNLEQGKI